MEKRTAQAVQLNLLDEQPEIGANALPSIETVVFTDALVASASVALSTFADTGGSEQNASSPQKAERRRKNGADTRSPFRRDDAVTLRSRQDDAGLPVQPGKFLAKRLPRNPGQHQKRPAICATNAPHQLPLPFGFLHPEKPPQ